MFKDNANTQKLKQKYKDEQVFVVPTSHLTDIADGFTEREHSLDIYSKYDQIGKYIYRYDAEGDSAFQQIIPYVVIYNPTDKKYFVYERTNSSGESRLHNKLSIGFGGHINPCDGTVEVLFKGMYRELTEELDYNNVAPANFVGYVRDINSATNDHTGAVFILPVNKAEVREKEKYIGRWMTSDQLVEDYFSFEDWGKHLINYIVKRNY